MGNSVPFVCLIPENDWPHFVHLFYVMKKIKGFALARSVLAHLGWKVEELYR